MAVPPGFISDFSDLSFEQPDTMDVNHSSLDFQNTVSLDIEGLLSHIREQEFVSNGRDELPSATTRDLHRDEPPTLLSVLLDHHVEM